MKRNTIQYFLTTSHGKHICRTPEEVAEILEKENYGTNIARGILEWCKEHRTPQQRGYFFRV